MIKVDSLTKAQLASAGSSVLLVVHAFVNNTFFIPTLLAAVNYLVYLQLVKFEKTQRNYKKLCRRIKALGR